MIQNRCRSDANKEYCCVANYPMVHMGSGTGAVCTIVYTSQRPPDKQFTCYPIGGGREECWNIETILTRDTQTQISAVSSLNLCGARPGCFLYSTLPIDISKLSGASIGMAAAAAVLGLGAKNLVFTGWFSSFGQEREGVSAGPVDSVDIKLDCCLKKGMILFFPLSILERPENRNTRTATYLTRNVYTMRDYLVGMPFTDQHRGVGVSNAAELVVIAQFLRLG